MTTAQKKTKVGVIGTGFIAKGFARAMADQPDLELSRVLTRRDIRECGDFPRPDLLTKAKAELIDHSDLIVECCGDVAHATDVIDAAFKASRPVVTMDAEWHVTVGSYFVDQGLVTEAEGDQPGVLAALREDMLQMGFRPLVYGNIKGFQNLDPTPQEMRYWAQKQGLSLPMVTSATDGTKVQFEQALVANGFGADMLQEGFTALETRDVEQSAKDLAAKAKQQGRPVSDYVISAKFPSRVFIAAEHDETQQAALEYLKLGTGPYYVLYHNTTLCHLEIIKTVRRVLNGGGVLLNNSVTPRISMAAVAKKDLPAGTIIDFACGSFELRGHAVPILDHPGHVPIGLLNKAVIRRSVSRGQILTRDDVEVPDSLAVKAWKQIIKKISHAKCDK